MREGSGEEEWEEEREEGKRERIRSETLVFTILELIGVTEGLWSLACFYTGTQFSCSEAVGRLSSLTYTASMLKQKNASSHKKAHSPATSVTFCLELCVFACTHTLVYSL